MKTFAMRTTPLALLCSLALLAPIQARAVDGEPSLAATEAALSALSAQARAAAGWAAQAMSQCRAIGMASLPQCARSPGREAAATGHPGQEIPFYFTAMASTWSW